MGKAKAKSVTIKKKQWFAIIAPPGFDQREVGETYLAEPSLVIGKVTRVNLMDLTGDPKKQSTEIAFEIVESKGDQFITDVLAYEIIPAHFRRIVKRAKTRAEDSFICVTQDGTKVRIKPSVLTASKATRSVLNALRTRTKDTIVEYAKKKSFEQLIKAIISNELQKEIKGKINKIFPVTICLIKKIEKIKKV